MGLFNNETSPFWGQIPFLSVSGLSSLWGGEVTQHTLLCLLCPREDMLPKSSSYSPVPARAPPNSSSLCEASAAVATVQLSLCPEQQDVRILSHYISYPLQGALSVEADSSAFWCVGCFLLTELCLHNFLESLYKARSALE